MSAECGNITICHRYGVLGSVFRASVLGRIVTSNQACFVVGAKREAVSTHSFVYFDQAYYPRSWEINNMSMYKASANAGDEGEAGASDANYRWETGYEKTWWV